MCQVLAVTVADRHVRLHFEIGIVHRFFRPPTEGRSPDCVFESDMRIAVLAIVFTDDDWIFYVYVKNR
jgi:hypothetical protein